MRDAVIAGIHLNTFNNHSDRVKMANIAQAVNVLQAPVLTEGDKIVLTPTWHVFHLFKGHQDAELLETSFASENVGDYEKNILVPGLSVSASEKKNEKTGKIDYLVTIVNVDCEKSNSIDVSFANLPKKIEKATGSVICSEKMNDFNSFEKPNTVVEKSLKVEISDGERISVELPPNSVASVCFSI